MLRRQKLSVVLILLILVSSSSIVQPFFVLAQTGQETIDIAEKSIRQAFSSVFEAERAGGNVSFLLAELNSAGSLLSEAERAYQLGNVTETKAKAANAALIAENVKNEAVNLKEMSAADLQGRYWLNIVFSTAASAVFIVMLIVIWRKLKRMYVTKISSLKPEVKSVDET